MHWKRSTCGILLSGSLCVFSMGCAAMNAIVSSPAGTAAGQRSPERMAAIGRVFENQGKYAQAQAMYRKALSEDPKSQIAQERLNAIVAMNSNKSFQSSEKKTPSISMLAVADSLNGQNRLKPRRLGARPVESLQEPVRMAASLTPAKTSGTLLNITADVAKDVTETVEPDASEVLKLTDPGWKLDQNIARNKSEVANAALSFAPANDATTLAIATVGFEGSDNKVATVASHDDSWKSANRIVSLEALIEWSEAPADNTDNLLFALTDGQDDAVKAYAATLLVECPADNVEINAALRNVSKTASPLLRVSSRDTLIQRGELDNDTVNDLLELLTESHAAIQSQAAASLRNIAGTQWAPQCVSRLTEMLTDGDSTVETVAAATLGDFGADATSSRNALSDVAANSTDELTRAAADLALNRIPAADCLLPPVETTAEDNESTPTQSVNGYLPIVE